MRAHDAEGLVKRFGSNLALELGYRSVGNFIAPALLVTLPGEIGESGIIVWFSLTFVLCALLELPTGVIGDRVGWRRSIAIGYRCRLLARLGFSLAVFLALVGQEMFAWAVLVLQAFVNAVGTSLFSGSFQAAYGKWYDENLAKIGRSREESPDLFVRSNKYGFLIRLSAPLLGLCAAFSIEQMVHTSALDSDFGGLVARIAVSLIPVFPLVLVMTRIDSDLSSISQSTSQSMGSTSGYVASFLSSLRSNKSTFLLFLYSDIVAQLCVVYIGSEIFKSIAKYEMTDMAVWAGGGAFMIAVEAASTVLSRWFLPYFGTQNRGAQLIWIAPLLSSAGAAGCLSYILKFSDFSSLFAVLAFVVLSSVFCRGLTSFAVEEATKNVEEEHRATWLSGASLASLLATGATTSFVGLAFASSVHLETVIAVILAMSIVFLFSFLVFRRTYSKSEPVDASP